MPKTARKKRLQSLLRQAGWTRKLLEEEGLILHRLENDSIWRYGTSFEADRLFFRRETGMLEIGLTVEDSAGMSAHLDITYYIVRDISGHGSWSISWTCEPQAPPKFRWLLKNNGFDPTALRGGLPGRERKEWPTEPRIERLLRDCARFLLGKPLLKTGPLPETERSSHACEG